MHAAEEEVDAEIGEEDAQEGDEHVEVEKEGGTEDFKALAVKWEGINEHGYQCPYFFGIPAPITSPTDICPYGSDKYTYCQTENSRVEQQER